jgi:hypothetical protein
VRTLWCGIKTQPLLASWYAIWLVAIVIIGTVRT